MLQKNIMGVINCICCFRLAEVFYHSRDIKNFSTNEIIPLEMPFNFTNKKCVNVK